jgi:hypothetical protein
MNHVLVVATVNLEHDEIRDREGEKMIKEFGELLPIGIPLVDEEFADPPVTVLVPNPRN